MSNQSPIPALGLAWSTCVNNRFTINRLSNSNYFVRNEIEPSEDKVDGNSIQKISRRNLRLVFSPSHPPASCQFEIRGDGIFGTVG
jgi:hypothetical protein